MVEPPVSVQSLSSDSEREARPRRVEKLNPTRKHVGLPGRGQAFAGSVDDPVLLSDDEQSLTRYDDWKPRGLLLGPSNLQASLFRRSMLTSRPVRPAGQYKPYNFPFAQLETKRLSSTGPYMPHPTTQKIAVQSEAVPREWSSDSNHSFAADNGSGRSSAVSESSGKASFVKALERNEVRISLQFPKCVSCTEMRVSCDGEQPCSTCAEPGIECEYKGQRKPVAPLQSTSFDSGSSPVARSHPQNVLQPSKLEQNSVKRGLSSTTERQITPLVASRDKQNWEVHASEDDSTDEEEVDPILLEPQAFEHVLHKYETQLRAFLEYTVQPRLRQNRLDSMRAPRPKLEKTLQSPFACLQPKTLPPGSEQGSKPAFQIQLKTQAKGVPVNKTKWKSVIVPITKIKTDVTSLPKYKSIGRVGPSILALNVRTSKYRPYDAADEHIEDAGITKKYNELMQRYEHNDESMKRQRKCLELVQMWTPWAEQILAHLQITPSDVLYYYLRDSEVGWRPEVAMSEAAWSAWTLEQRACCKTCKIDGDWDERGKWDSIAKLLPVPDGRASAVAGLASHAFHKVSHVSLWHIVSTSDLVQDLKQKAHNSEGKRHHESDLCAICYVHNCPTHGSYYESDGDDTRTEQEAAINDDEDEHNTRTTVSLPATEPGEKQDHLCGVFCVDQATQLTAILGRTANGLVAGSCRQVKESPPALSAEKLCGADCFWDIRNRRQVKVSELTRGNIPPLSRPQWELFEVILPLHLKNRRAPCMLARIMEDVTCISLFYHMLNRIGKTPHLATLALDMSGDSLQAQQARKLGRIPAGIDTSNSAELDARAPFVPCSHDGPCQNNPDCSCAHDQIFCEWFCGCDMSCKRRFKGCSCAGINKVCFNDSRCECWAHHRECDPFLCKSCGVLEVLDSFNKYNDEIRKGRCRNNRLQLDLPARTIKAPSEVQGYGLFAGEDLEEHAYIGEYRGEIVSAAESDRRGAVYHILGAEYLFVINRDQEMDASNVGNKMRFMNNSQKESNINVLARKMLCNGVQRVMLYAKRKIQAGEELLYNYNYPIAVTKKFWERGEKPSSATGAIVALGPKTTTPAAGPARANGRFGKSLPGAVDEDDRSDEDNSQSPLTSRSRRKRKHEEFLPPHDFVVPSRTHNTAKQARAFPRRLLDASEESDDDEETEAPEDELEESSEQGDSSESDHHATPRSRVKGPRRNVGPKDGRLGGKAQAAAWKTRKKNLAGIKGYRKVKR